MSAMSVLISAAAVLGKANLVQLAFMTVVEVTAFGTVRLLNQHLGVSRGALRRWKGRVLPPFGEAAGILENKDRPKCSCKLWPLLV